MRIIKDTKIDFMGIANIGALASALLIIAGLGSMIVKGGPKLSIDFKGGTLIAVRYAKPMDINDGRSYDFSQAEIKHFGDKYSVAVRLPNIENEPEKFLTKFVEKMAELFPDMSLGDRDNFILSIEKVGPKIGAELSGDALMAIISALGLILIYISLRFEWKYAIGSIAALTHDVMITLGIFSLLDYEVSLAVLAAFLTIVGYSLNDTIVIFDRVRENVKIMKQESMKKIVNKSINNSLSRTIITSLTTFFVVLVLFLLGGEVIHTFAFAMIVGVIVGTYSSIFIASPIIVKMASSHSKEKNN